MLLPPTQGLVIKSPGIHMSLPSSTPLNGFPCLLEQSPDKVLCHLSCEKYSGTSSLSLGSSCRGLL